MDAAVATGRCLETTELLALVEGECDDAARRAALAHAAGCESCRQAIAGIAKAVRSDLDAGSSDAHAAATEEHPPGELGRYRIVRVIGRGAMGTVYEAFDPLLRRRVAIKRIHAGVRELGPRLRREAQTLARLADPHVVAVLQAGPDWIAMELVLGDTLASWQRGRAWPQIVEAYLQAARGLAAAHAVGVVHRDFKPSNVLIDARRVRVADFGLSTAVELDVSEPAGILRSGGSGLVGTPAYMAPEQFLGRVADAQSDQFAFCVALHEALAGVRPFAGDDVMSLCTAVLAGRIRSRPRTAVPAAIWRVIERGLAGDPHARWPSMQALVDALGRARTRHGAPWLLAASILALGLAAWLGRDDGSSCTDAANATWTPARARTMTAAVVDSGLEYARATADGVGRQLDGWSERWTRARGQLCEAKAPDRAALACLDDQLIARDELVRRLATGDREAVLGAARAAQRLPSPAVCTGATAPPERPPAARELSRELIAERATLSLHSKDDDLPRLERLVARADALGDPATIGDARALLGAAQALCGRWELAMPTLEDAYFRSYELGDDASASDSALNLALGATWEGHHEDALRWVRLSAARAIDDAQRADAAPVEAQVLHALGRSDEAERALASALATTAPSYARVAALTMIATIHTSAGRPELAEPPLVEAVALIEHEAGATHPDLGRPLNVLGIVQIQRGRLRDAVVTLGRAREVMAAQLGEHHPMIAFPLGNLALAQGDLGDREGAYQSLLQVLEIFERSGAADPQRLSPTLHNLALQSLHAGRPADVLRHATRALEIDRGLGDAQVIEALGYVARGRRATGDSEGAMRAWDELLALRRASGHDDDDSLGWSELETAITASDAGSNDRAEPHLVRALECYARSTGTSPIERGRAERIAARVRVADPVRARDHLQRAARLLLVDADPADPRRPTALLDVFATWIALGGDAFAPWAELTASGVALPGSVSPPMPPASSTPAAAASIAPPHAAG